MRSGEFTLNHEAKLLRGVQKGWPFENQTIVGKPVLKRSPFTRTGEIRNSAFAAGGDKDCDRSLARTLSGCVPLETNVMFSLTVDFRYADPT